MTEENIQLPDYLCFKPSKAKLGQNGICQGDFCFFSYILFFVLQVCFRREC